MFLGGRTRTHSDATHRLDRAEVAQHVHRDERVVVELAAVQDATLARSVEHLLRREDLVPQLVDGAHLREEAVAADVEAPALALHCLADATDDVGRLEHGHFARVAGFHQLVRGGEAGRPRADDDDGSRAGSAALAAHARHVSLGHFARHSQGSSAREGLTTCRPCRRRAVYPAPPPAVRAAPRSSRHQEARERQYRAGDEHRAERDEHDPLAGPAPGHLGRGEHQRHGREAVALERIEIARR